MKKTLYPGLALLLLACGQKTAPTVPISTVPKEPIIIQEPYEPDELLVDEYQVRVYGKPNIDEDDIGDIELKFLTPVWFDDYAIKPISPGTPKAPINYKSHPIAREYKTVITGQYKTEPVNFAGHYVFTSWGCGSPCTGSAIVDVLTGRVYEGPTSGNGFQVQANSRLLLGNTPDSAGFYTLFSDGCCVPVMYVFNEGNKTFKELEMHRYEEE